MPDWQGMYLNSCQWKKKLSGHRETHSAESGWWWKHSFHLGIREGLVEELAFELDPEGCTRVEAAAWGQDQR